MQRLVLVLLELFLFVLLLLGVRLGLGDVGLARRALRHEVLAVRLARDRLLDGALGAVAFCGSCGARAALDRVDDAAERHVGVAALEDDGRDGAVRVELEVVRRDVGRGDRGVEEVVKEERDVRRRGEGEGASCEGSSARVRVRVAGRASERELGTDRASCRRVAASRRPPTRRWRG